MEKRKYTMITGASSGLGKAMALECARLKMNLILVALPGRDMNYFASLIADRYNVDVLIFELDLTDETAMEGLINSISHYPVNFLVNNAGIGGSSDFASTPPAVINQIIRLNIGVTSLLTRLMIPTLLEQEKSYVLNISSISAFSPIAYKSVYPASKAFIYSFSLGLREEFRGSNLSVSAVYPGPMLTNSNTTRRIIEQGFMARAGLLSSSHIARIAINRTLKGKAIIVPGLLNKLNYLLMRVIPPLIKSKLVSGVVKKEVRMTQPLRS